MPSDVLAHYDRLLAEHYTWMATGGDYARGVADSLALFEQLGLRPGDAVAPSSALDLGSGPGMQSAALLAAGYATVTAVDLCAPLVRELETRNTDAIETGRLRPVVGDVLDPGVYRAASPVNLAVCLGDTLTHLPERADVPRLLALAHDALAPGGRLALRFRDLTHPLAGPERFIPVRSDADKVMTCFLEPSDDDHIGVTDLIYTRSPDGDAAWQLHKSAYRKLRLGAAEVAGYVRAAGFSLEHETTGPGGLVTLLGRKG